MHSPRRMLLCLVAVFLAVLAGIAPAAGQVRHYTVSISGIGDKALVEAVRNVSQLDEHKDQAALSLRALRLRTDAALERVETLLRSRGYYGSTITYDILRPDSSDREIALKIDTGPPYMLAAYDIVSTTPGEPRNPIDVPYETLGIDTSVAVQADQIIAADSRLLASLARQTYPLARILERKTTVDHASRSVRVSVSLDMGAAARFGATSLDGLSSVEPVVLERAVFQRPDQPCRRR